MPSGNKKSLILIDIITNSVYKLFNIMAQNQQPQLTEEVSQILQKQI